MPARKVDTIDLKGNDYAKFPDRIKLFWEDCPDGKIITVNELDATGQREFYAYVWRNKKDYVSNDLNSADSKGSALGNTKGQKDFEKLETIAIGRALAILGYLASGEVASFEEIEEYHREQEEKRFQYITEQVELFELAKSMDELKQLWLFTDKTIPVIQQAKDKKKGELENEVSTTRTK